MVEEYADYEEIFTLLRGNAQFDLRPELSTESNKLHFHGYIAFENSDKLSAFYFITIPHLKELCTFTLVPIEDHWIWYLYCRKQRHNLKHYIQHCCKRPYHITTNTDLSILLH